MPDWIKHTVKNNAQRLQTISVNNYKPTRLYLLLVLTASTFGLLILFMMRYRHQANLTESGNSIHPHELGDSHTSMISGFPQAPLKPPKFNPCTPSSITFMPNPLPNDLFSRIGIVSSITGNIRAIRESIINRLVALREEANLTEDINVVDTVLQDNSLKIKVIPYSMINMLYTRADFKGCEYNGYTHTLILADIVPDAGLDSSILALRHSFWLAYKTIINHGKPTLPPTSQVASQMKLLVAKGKARIEEFQKYYLSYKTKPIEMNASQIDYVNRYSLAIKKGFAIYKSHVAQEEDVVSSFITMSLSNWYSPNFDNLQEEISQGHGFVQHIYGFQAVIRETTICLYSLFYPELLEFDIAEHKQWLQTASAIEVKNQPATRLI